MKTCLFRMAVLTVASVAAAAAWADLDAAGRAEYEALRKEIAAILKTGRTAEALPLQEKVLKLDLNRKERYAALEGIGANYNHSLQRKKEAKPYYLKMIAMLEEDLKELEGLDRARKLAVIENIYRRQIQMRPEANKLVAEELALLKTAEAKADGFDRLSLRQEIHNAMMRASRDKATEESKSWDGETKVLVIRILDGAETLTGEAWLKKLVKPAMLMEILSTDEAGLQIAVARIADRVFALDPNVKAFAAAQKGLMHTATNIAKRSNSHATRGKAAGYYHVCGAKLFEGEARYRNNYDLAGARKAFAALPNDPLARDWLEMLADAPDPRLQIAYAGEELTNWVTKISGRVPATADYVLGLPETSSEAKSFAARHATDFARLADNDGFILAQEGGKTFIVAARAKGVLNGVYRLLERNSDIIWVRELEGENGFGTVYTKNPDFRNGVKYLCDVPAIGIRFWTGNWSDAQLVWQARMLNNFGHPYDGGLGPKQYKLYAKLGDMTECETTLSLELLRKYQETDPDVYPWQDGKRLTYHDCQLCFMNPKTARLFAAEAEKKLVSMPKRVRGIGIGLGDNSDCCLCREWCARPIDLPGGKKLQPEAKNFRSTQYQIFVNRVYEILKPKFPWLRAPKAQSYLFTAEPPAVPVPGGAGCYCPYVKNHKKPVYDDAVNATWHRKAEAFRAAGLPFTGLYEYYLCSSTPQFYHATMEVMQKDLLYYGKDLRSCYNDVVYHDGYDGLEGTGAGGVYDASAIEFYVCSRLMWDPKTDIRAARREFCRRAYHGAAGIMADYYEKLARNYNEDPAGCFWNDDPVIAAKHYVVEKDLAAWLRETLAKAEKAATDPRSRELIRRHRVHMEWLVGLAEKAPKKVTLEVGTDWTKVGPLTKISDAATPADGRTKVWVRNDSRVFEFKTEVKNPAWRKIYDDFAARGKVGTSQNDRVPFDWCNCIEIFLDGNLKTGGSYYHLCVMFNGRTHTGFGSGDATEPVAWAAKVEPITEGLVITATWPLSSLGIEISKDNKVGAMFLVNGSAWNGGQWHSPAGFQTLKLNMK